MKLRLRTSGPPLYRQISDQIRRRIAAGRLAAGDRLPSVRALAEDLAVNPNTVARAYRELERDRFLVGRQGDGVFVADRSSPFLERDRRRLLERAVDTVLSEAEQLDFGLDEVLEEIESRRPLEGTRRQG